jgi:hypothetical protein
LFQQAFEAAQSSAEKPKDLARLGNATARLMALGRGIVAERLGGLLDRLPLPSTLEAPVYLPLHFAIHVLRAARDRQRKKVRAALDELRDCPNLRDYYRWFAVLADRFCGCADMMPGVPGKLLQPPPLPPECLTPAVWQEVQRGLGFVPQESSTSTKQWSQSVQISGRASPVPASEPDAGLNRRHYDILEALYRPKAFTCDSSRTTAEIGCQAEGEHVNPESFKTPVKQLRYRGLVETKPGRGGGVWLTGTGRELIRSVRRL